MKRRTRSILEEISSIGRVYDRKELIAQNAKNLIASYGHIISLLRETFDEETSAELERRLLNSIRSADESKFTRSLQRCKIQERPAKPIQSRLLGEEYNNHEDDDAEDGDDNSDLGEDTQ